MGGSERKGGREGVRGGRDGRGWGWGSMSLHECVSLYACVVLQARRSFSHSLALSLSRSLARSIPCSAPPPRSRSLTDLLKHSFYSSSSPPLSYILPAPTSSPSASPLPLPPVTSSVPTVNVYMHTCTHAHMHTCAHAHMRTCTHAHMHTCARAHMHPCTHAHMHTCTHAHMHTDRHRQTQTDTHPDLLSANTRPLQKCPETPS